MIRYIDIDMRIFHNITKCTVLSIQIEKQRSTVYEKFHCTNSTRLLNILSRSFWRIMFVASVKDKSLLKVNTRKALRSSLTCTFILENIAKNLSHEFCQNIALTMETFILKELPK